METPNISSEKLERDLIASIIKDSYAASYILSSCVNEDFYDQVRLRIFAVCKSLYEKNGYINRDTLENMFRAKVTDYQKYTIEIDKCILYYNGENYENKVKELKSFTFRRKIYSRSIEIAGIASDLSNDIDVVSQLATNFNAGLFTGYEDVARDAEQILSEQKESELIYHNDSFLDDIFYKFGGRSLGTTELIFGRPGQGKTYYLFYKEGMFVNSGYKGLHFHLEDSEHEAAIRYMAVVDRSSPNFKNLKIITKHKYLHEIIQDIRYYKHKYDIKFFSIDHLGRIRVAGYDSRNKIEAQIEASNRLTDLCIELDVFGMFCVQPNKTKDRKGWQNLLREEDLKGATEVFEDAFVVTTLLRPNIYPELRSQDGMSVKDPSSNLVHYDSLFVTKIKDRRQRLENIFLHLVQKGDRLYKNTEYSKLFNTTNSKSIEIDNEEARF